MRIIIWLSCLFVFQTIEAQQITQGKVFDSQNNALAFVNILVNGNPSEGMTSDIDGFFQIESNPRIQFLEFRYVGYETLQFSLENEDLSKALSIQMQSANFQLAEAVVLAGENPAHRIIKKVVANRKYNQPKFFDAYQCKTYNKMHFDFLPNKESFGKHLKEKKLKGKSNGLQNRRDSATLKYFELAEQRHLMLIETITEKNYLAPNKHQEKVLMNQVSGFKDPHFVALAKDAQPFSFYEPQIEVLGNTFLNPISKGSTKAYFFELKDTLFQAQDSIFIISFRPKKGKTFEGLKGVLYIHSNHFALQNVVAEPADSSLTKITFEQKYTYHISEKKWFPEQLNFEWEMPKYPSPHVGLKIVGKSYISDVNFRPTLDKKTFTADKYILTENANQRADSIWEKERYELLSTKEKDTYIWWDTVPSAQNMERIFNFSESLVSGIYPMSKVDIDLQRLLAFNDYEKTRLGFGLQSNNGFSKRLRLGAFVGYGIGDKAWKYGADIRLKLAQKQAFFLEFGYEKNTRVPGIPQFPTLDFSNYQLIDNGLYDFRMDTYSDWYTKMGATLFKNAQVSLALSQNTWQANYNYQFVSDEGSEQRAFDFTEIQLNLRLAPGEQYVPFMGTKIANPTHLPVLQIQLKKGIDLFKQGHSVFEQYLFAIAQTIPLKRCGTMSYRIESAWSSNDLPYTKLFNQSGIGYHFRLFDFSHSFQTMGQYEYLSDRYIALFFEHNFGTISKKNKWIQPEISLLQNIAFGQLDMPEKHQGIEFKTLEKGFFESGVALNNLLRLNYFNFAYIGLGWASYIRLNNNLTENAHQNIAHRLTLNLDF